MPTAIQSRTSSAFYWSTTSLAQRGKPDTTADGRIEKEISPAAEGGEVRVRGQVYFLKIGNLDPETEESGQRARLANLGYYFGEGADVDEDEFRTAVEEFHATKDCL